MIIKHIVRDCPVDRSVQPPGSRTSAPPRQSAHRAQHCHDKDPELVFKGAAGGEGGRQGREGWGGGQ